MLSGFFVDMFKNRSCAWQNLAVFLSNFFLFSFTPPILSLRKFSKATTIWSWVFANCYIKEREKKNFSIFFLFQIFISHFTILSRSSSMLAINLLNCFKLLTITCSSSVWVVPMHSKLNSSRLFDRVRWARDKSEKDSLIH